MRVETTKLDLLKKIFENKHSQDTTKIIFTNRRDFTVELV